MFCLWNVGFEKVQGLRKHAVIGDSQSACSLLLTARLQPRSRQFCYLAAVCLAYLKYCMLPASLPPHEERFLRNFKLTQ